MRYPIRVALRHADLYRFSDSHLAPALRGGGLGPAFEQVAEQVYVVGLLDPGFCARLVEEAEACPRWRAGLRRDFYQPPQDDPPADEPADGLSLEELPGLCAVYNAIADRAVSGLFTRLWRSYEPRLYRTPYVVRFGAAEGMRRGQGPHWDQTGISMSVALDDGYEGGGTYFPRWRFWAGRPPVGSALVFPGGIAHEHEERPVLAGRRRLLACEFF
jgi:hypothetical protein